jgi:hypothetical protein
LLSWPGERNADGSRGPERLDIPAELAPSTYSLPRPEPVPSAASASGHYQARYWHVGKQIPADTTFASKTDARRWLATTEADMFRGVGIDPNAGKIPLGEYATRWVAERPVLPRTREIYECQLRHIFAVFADVHLCDVHPVAVRTWHGHLVR